MFDPLDQEIMDMVVAADSPFAIKVSLQIPRNKNEPHSGSFACKPQKSSCLLSYTSPLKLYKAQTPLNMNSTDDE